MKANNRHYRTIWATADDEVVEIIDQRWLPHRFETEQIATYSEMATAIRDMHIRGAGAIGAAAGFGMYLAVVSSSESSVEETIEQAAAELKASRPTAINLEWAIDRRPILESRIRDGGRDCSYRIRFRNAGLAPDPCALLRRQ